MLELVKHYLLDRNFHQWQSLMVQCMLFLQILLHNFLYDTPMQKILLDNHLNLCQTTYPHFVKKRTDKAIGKEECPDCYENFKDLYEELIT